MDNLQKISLWQKISQKLTAKVELNTTKYKPLKRASRLLSIDMNADSCCFLKISGSFPNLTLTHADICITPKESIKDNKLKNPLALESTLSNIVQRDKLKAEHCAFCIAGNLAINKQININKNLSDEQLQTKAMLEAQKAFPDNNDELYIDYTRTDTQNNHQVLNIIAAHKTDLEPYLQALKKSHLKPSVVDLDYYALDRIYPLLISQLSAEKQAQCNASFYLTSDYILMTINKGNELIYTHRHPFHNPNIKRSVESIITDAEETIPVAPEDLDAIGKSISHLLQFYFAEFSNDSVGNILLTGPLAVIPHIAQHITQYTTIPSYVAKLFDHVNNKTSINQEHLQKIAPAFVMSLSLAMRTN